MRRCPRERSARLALPEEIKLVQAFTTSAAYVWETIAHGDIPTSLFLQQKLPCCAYLFLVFVAKRICLSCLLYSFSWIFNVVRLNTVQNF